MPEPISDPDTSASPAHEALRAQIRAAAEVFASDTKPLAEILTGLVDDVERAAREPLEIFPVCHHSPSSALHMVRRLRERAPRVIFMECCEDLRPLLDGLAECTLPVALQAFSSQTEGFPADWSPLNLVCPLTEFSAEFQAIAFSLTHPEEVELVFVDRSADHFFQWKPRDDAQDGPEKPEEAPAATAPSAAGDEPEAGREHGAAQAVELGDSEPTLREFTETLLRNARVAHYSEWWDQYVEEAVIGSDYRHYREVFFLVGSLIRRLGRRDEDIAEDELRERFMWTRMKRHLAERGLRPEEALYICGAAHAASRVEEFGAESPVLWDIPERSKTEWLYGLLPSSYAAIERQFGHPAGSASLAEDRWRRELRKARLTAFRLPKKGKAGAAAAAAGEEAEELAADDEGQGDGAEEENANNNSKTKAKGKAAAKAAAAAAKPARIPVALPPEREGDLATFLSGPPPATEEDQDTLLDWCAGIVSSARRHGYMSGTADSIAIYQTSVLLANLRNRRHPTPWDFRDAAVTCLEKDSVPKRRDIGRLCDLLLGGDRIGRIGYDSLPPLARDVYDRLKVLPIQLEARNIQRALLDFTKHPEWLPASDLLWKLRCLLPPDVVRPIMGQRELGAAPPRQESWDLAIGRNQGAIIQLGYEGVTVEFVLEQRLRRKAFGAESRTVDALAAAEESILFLKNPRLTAELGSRARALLISEPDVRDAAKIYARIARLIHYYRAFTALPEWCAEFVTTGYSHYCTLLPNAFNDRGAKPAEVAAMLQFILTLESLALSLGCERSELVIAVRQAGLTATDPVKLALLWSVECVLQLRTIAALRAQFDRVLDNPVALTTLPSWLNGFLLSLSFTPVMGGFTVELMSRAFASLPDEILMPWLPSLLMGLKEHANAGGALATLLKEAAAVFPRSLPALEAWTPPWERQSAAKGAGTAAAGSAAKSSTPSRDDRAGQGAGNGLDGSVSNAGLVPGSAPVRRLLRQYPAATGALAALLGSGEGWSESGGETVAESGASEEFEAAAGEGDGDAGFSPAAALLSAWPAAAIALSKLAGSPSSC